MEFKSPLKEGQRRAEIILKTSEKALRFEKVRKL
jgi:hypothetical protein